MYAVIIWVKLRFMWSRLHQCPQKLINLLLDDELMDLATCGRPVRCSLDVLWDVRDCDSPDGDELSISLSPLKFGVSEAWPWCSKTLGTTECGLKARFKLVFNDSPGSDMKWKINLLKFILFSFWTCHKSLLLRRGHAMVLIYVFMGREDLRTEYCMPV